MTGNPPNGGVDLGALRGPSKRHREAMINSMLNQQGLACPMTATRPALIWRKIKAAQVRLREILTTCGPSEASA